MKILTSLVTYKNSVIKDKMSDALKKFYQKNTLIEGFCQPQSCEKFTKIDQNVNSSHWRQPKYIPQKLKISSIGIGTQGGQPSAEADLKMFQILYQSINSGKVNFIDTDINFRYGKSEKTINAVLNFLQQEGRISRNSLFLATKCGYVPNDIDSDLDQKKFLQILYDEGYIKSTDVVNQIHCLHPNFIKISVQKSLLALGVRTIDLLYLNNPTESQQTVIGKNQYFSRLQKAFECLQSLRQSNKIKYFGIASFISFRSPPTEDGIHVQLEQIVKIAEKIGGKSHGLRFILIPFNLGMPEVLLKWQKNSKTNTEQHIFTVAQQKSININFCCPLFQGRVASLPFKAESLNNLSNNSAKHLQFIRSVPKQSVLSTIFSTLDLNHLSQNLQVVNQPYLTDQQWRKVLPF